MRLIAPLIPRQEIKLCRSNGRIEVAIDDALGILHREARRPDRHVRSDPVLFGAKVGAVGPHDGDDAADGNKTALRFVQVDGIVAIRTC